ncbi:MAG: cation diffusion facilitator family transporter [Gammaproteobacteria bacterium]
MSDCCHEAACEIEKLRERQRSTLQVVLAINGVMFVVEAVAGLLAGSTALLADSLDMLGDTLVYGFSLVVVARNDEWKAISALIKGAIMAVFGVSVLAQAAYKFLHPELPQFETIGSVGLLVLFANSACFILLRRHRTEDVNMRSVWLCSRNDIIANVSVLFAAFGVWSLKSQWPDVLVGLGIAVLFLRSAQHVIRDAMEAYKGYRQDAVNETRNDAA